MKHFIIQDIIIEVNKKKIKNMHLRILPPEGRVVISAPIYMKDKDIQMFVLSKLEWIRKNQEKYRNQPPQPKLSYVTGEHILLCGKQYRLEVIYSGRTNLVEVYDDIVQLKVRESSTVAQREHLLNSFYRSILKVEVPKLIEKWEKIIGVKANVWGIKNMKTRWGTCNVNDKRIWINLQLAKKKPICLEYVVIHELVHLLETKHNNRFKSYMDQFMPNWRDVKVELNQNY